jgi:hypothetical protein
MTIQIGGAEKQRIAQVVKDACLQAALEGYEYAAMSGLCHEGAWEICGDEWLVPRRCLGGCN